MSQPITFSLKLLNRIVLVDDAQFQHYKINYYYYFYYYYYEMSRFRSPRLGLVMQRHVYNFTSLLYIIYKTPVILHAVICIHIILYSRTISCFSLVILYPISMWSKMPCVNVLVAYSTAQHR